MPYGARRAAALQSARLTQISLPAQKLDAAQKKADAIIEELHVSPEALFCWSHAVGVVLRSSANRFMSVRRGGFVTFASR
jgi:hypothetical protein